MAIHTHARVLSLLGWDLVEMLEAHSRLKNELNTVVIPQLCANEYSSLMALCEELIGKLTIRVMHAFAKRLGLSVLNDSICVVALVQKFPRYKRDIYRLSRKVGVPFQETYEQIVEKTMKTISKKRGALENCYDPSTFTNLSIFIDKMGGDPSAITLLEDLRKNIPYAKAFRLEQAQHLRKFLTKIDGKYPPTK